MRDDLANIVYPIFGYGLKLKESLATGMAPDFATARKELIALLQIAATGQRLADTPSAAGTLMTSSRSSSDTAFLGVRYPLVCWLDEIFCLDSSWKAEWTENILEHSLFGSRDRAWKFWEQAKKAEGHAGGDSLEVFYLAVMLGFRGDYEGHPEKLRSWCESAKALVDKGQPKEWKGPVEAQARTHVPPLTGARKLQKMLLVWGLGLLVLIPAAMFLLFHSMR